MTNLVDNEHHGLSAQHPLQIFGGRGCQQLTKSICSYLEITQGKHHDKPFPNGEIAVKAEDDVRGRDVFVVVSLCRQYMPNEFGHSGVNDALMELLTWGDTLSRASAHRITAVIPHFGYARQDRKAAGRTPITARLVADMIIEAGFNRVLTMDLHADQIQGFFPRNVPLDHLNAGQIFADWFNGLDLKDAVLLSADVGNLKKLDKYRRGFNHDVGIAMIDKRRADDGTITGKHLIGDSVDGKSVCLFDDIISTAGTMRQAIDMAMEHGAKDFRLAATHAEFVGNAAERLKHPLIKEICVTDTIPWMPSLDHLPKKILSVAELFAEAILRIHRYESISDLLGVYG